MPASSTTMARRGIPDTQGIPDTDHHQGPGGPGYGNNGSLQITRAYYGLNNRTNDVTQILRSMVRNGTLVVQVNNNTMGGDPAKGGDKVLTARHLWLPGTGANLHRQRGKRAQNSVSAESDLRNSRRHRYGAIFLVTLRNACLHLALRIQLARLLPEWFSVIRFG